MKFVCLRHIETGYKDGTLNFDKHFK